MTSITGCVAYLLLSTTRYRLLTAVPFVGQVSTVVVYITDKILWNAAVVSAQELVFTARYAITSTTFAHLPRYEMPGCTNKRQKQ